MSLTLISYFNRSAVRIFVHRWKFLSFSPVRKSSKSWTIEVHINNLTKLGAYMSSLPSQAAIALIYLHYKYYWVYIEFLKLIKSDRHTTINKKRNFLFLLNVLVWFFFEKSLLKVLVDQKKSELKHLIDLVL